jgi:hypothetical protein
LGASEYYKYRLFEGGRSLLEKERFAGWRLEAELDERFNAPSWLGVTTDKLVQYAIFKGLSVPIPEIHAVYHPSGRFFGEVPCITRPEELEDYLRNGRIPYPFFSKPAHGSFGRGMFGVKDYLSDRDELELLNGERIAVSEFVAQCHPREGVYPWRSGYLFQNYIAPHPELAKVCGSRLSSMRLIVLLADEGPKLFRAIWKVPTGGNMVDNYQHGEKGNLVAEVDRDTGDVLQVVGSGEKGRKIIEAHPDTGKKLVGLRIPCWQTMVKKCLKSATAFPALRMQFWDVAISEEGPVVLEVNIGGDLDLPQIASGKGVVDSEMICFVNRLSYSYSDYQTPFI